MGMHPDTAKHDIALRGLAQCLKDAGISVYHTGKENNREFLEQRFMVGNPGQAYISHTPDIFANHNGKSAIFDQKTTTVANKSTGNLAIDLFSWWHLYSATISWMADAYICLKDGTVINFRHLPPPFRVNIHPKWNDSELLSLCKKMAKGVQQYAINHDRDYCSISHDATGGTGDPFVLIGIMDEDGNYLVETTQLWDIFPGATFVD